jgi:DNA-binding MarR family transcriptional regulator
MLLELRRRVAAEIARYRLSGEFTATEIRTIEALWQEGVGLRELARRESVAPQAVTERIARLERRAPRFYRWWRLKNRCWLRRSI